MDTASQADIPHNEYCGAESNPSLFLHLAGKAVNSSALLPWVECGCRIPK